MSRDVTRRSILAGLMASAAGVAGAEAPLVSIRPKPRGAPPPPKPATQVMVQQAGLSGKIGYLAVDAKTGRVIDALNPGLRLPPASVAKAATAFYALSRLSPTYRFRTQLIATGPITDGTLDGDLVLRGSGDPTFDSDAMGAMAETLIAAGVTKVTGRFRVDASALPALPHIDPDQPDHVGYNPSIAGLNLNFNRVHFEWKRATEGYDVTMEARALEYSPAVRISRMEISDDRSQPVYTYDAEDGVDRWTVARRALGKEGARWLPVRSPADYAGEVFRTIARSKGLKLIPGPDAAGVTGTVLVTHESDSLDAMLKSMLRYSTNLTAEVAGLTATREASQQPTSLLRSAREMNLWFNKDLGTKSCGFVDHSGLGYGARVSAADMVTLMCRARDQSILPDLLRPVNVETKGAKVVGKTGTLNFVSALSGYAEAPGTPTIAYAIFTGDLPRRDAIPVAQRERPPGGRGWARQSRALQKRLIDSWLDLAST